jgi:hypothetical protein
VKNGFIRKFLPSRKKKRSDTLDRELRELEQKAVEDRERALSALQGVTEELRTLRTSKVGT